MSIRSIPTTLETLEETWQEVRDKDVANRVRLKPITVNHACYLKAIDASIITLCTGPAGTGKTYMACGKAAEFLREGRIKRIILTRPMVTCGANGKGMGFLPGDVKEKFSPYLRPLLDAFGDFFRREELTRYLNEGVIEQWPLDMMRGANIRDALVICDEAQNAEFTQLHMLLTRFADRTKVVVTGDATRTQTDVLHHGPNPLAEVIRRFRAKGRHPGYAVVELTRQDIVRHPFIQWVDEALTEEVEQGGEGGQERRWYDAICPSCTTRLWYEDGFETSDVDQLRCYRCATLADLWGDDGAEQLTIVKVRRGKLAETYPEEP